jgi:cell division protein FtsB
MREINNVATSREELLIMVRERLIKRFATVEREIESHKKKFEQLSLEKLEIQAELKVLENHLIDEQL